MSLVEGPHGGKFDMEKLLIFRNNKHVVVYRSIDELVSMVRNTVAHSGGADMRIEIEVLSTAVEQREVDDS